MRLAIIHDKIVIGSKNVSICSLDTFRLLKSTKCCAYSDGSSMLVEDDGKHSLLNLETLEESQCPRQFSDMVNQINSQREYGYALCNMNDKVIVMLNRRALYLWSRDNYSFLQINHQASMKWKWMDLNNNFIVVEFESGFFKLGFHEAPNSDKTEKLDDKVWIDKKLAALTSIPSERHTVSFSLSDRGLLAVVRK